jgi:hypothetical protein
MFAHAAMQKKGSKSLVFMEEGRVCLIRGRGGHLWIAKRFRTRDRKDHPYIRSFCASVSLVGWITKSTPLDHLKEAKMSPEFESQMVVLRGSNWVNEGVDFGENLRPQYVDCDLSD